MEKLTRKRVDLLDKLFNLGSAESTIISEINNRIDSYNQEEEKTKAQKDEYESERKNLETELLTFSSQAKDFLNAFGKYNNSSFEKLKKVDVDIEIGTIISQVRKSVPTYEKELNKGIKEQVNGISSCTKKIKELGKKREEAKEELSSATDLKDRLADLIEDILVNNNIASYTRGFIKKILNEFNVFSKEEINELEFLILFPESGLKLYEDYKENPYPLDDEKPEKKETIEIPKDEFIELQSMVAELEINAPTLAETMEKERAKKPTIKETMAKMREEAKTPTLKATMEARREKLKTPTLKETMARLRAEIEAQAAMEINAPTLKETMEKERAKKPTLKETMEKMRAERPEEPVVEEDELEKPLGPSLAETMEKMHEAKKTPTLKETMEKERAKKPTLAETMEKMRAEKTEVEEAEAKEYVVEEPEEEVNKVVEEIKEEDEFNDELLEIGIDPKAINGSNRSRIIKALKDADKKTLSNNFELLKSLDINPDNFYEIDNNDYMYLTDTELSNKVNTIRGKGIKDSVIKNQILNSGLKMNATDLENRIKQMADNKEELKESNIFMLNHDLVNIEKNIAKLNEAGMELDAKEKRNYMAVLERCNNIDDLINILTTYVVNLSKRNGKFELNILLSNAKELLFSLDDLIEKGLEDQISETPEVFDYNIDMILNRIVYCKENDIPIYDEDDNLIKDYIYDAREFVSSYPDVKLNDLITREEANEELEKAFDNEVASKLIATLNNYYEELDNYENVEPNNRELFEKLLNSIDELKITNIGKNTCKLNNVIISKNKLERNLSIIVNNLNDDELIDNNIKTTVLVSALYNLRENNIDDIVSKCNK